MEATRKPILLAAISIGVLSLGCYCFHSLTVPYPTATLEVAFKVGTPHTTLIRAFLGASKDGAWVGLKRWPESWLITARATSAGNKCSVKHSWTHKWLSAIGAASQQQARLVLVDQPDYSWTISDSTMQYAGLALDIYDPTNPSLHFWPVIHGGANQLWEIRAPTAFTVVPPPLPPPWHGMGFTLKTLPPPPPRVIEHGPRDSSSVVHCFFLLDATGSMSSIRDATIKGFNSYVAEQSSTPGTMRLSLIQFNSCSPFKVHLESEDVHNITPLAMADYQTTCMTPLYDAMAKTIEHAIETAAGNPDVVIVVMTDGDENASREWNRAQVFAKVEAMKKERGWTFVFLGANQDSFATGGDLGVAKAATTNWQASQSGTMHAYKSLSRATRGSRFARSALMKSMPDTYSTSAKAARSASWNF